MLFMEGRDSDPHVVWGNLKPTVHRRNLKSSSLGSESHSGHLKILEFFPGGKGAMSSKEKRALPWFAEGSQVGVLPPTGHGVCFTFYLPPILKLICI